MPERERLDQDIAAGRGFHRSGKHGPFSGIRRKLIEQRTLAPSADYVQPPDAQTG